MRSTAMAWVWTGMVALSVVFGAVTGNLGALGGAAIEGARSAVELCVSMAGVMCLWTGVMEVMNQSGLSALLARMFRPLLRRLLPQTSRDEDTIAVMTTQADPTRVMSIMDIFTVEFFDSLSISLLGLAISIWVFSTQLGLRRLASFSMPCLFLSINEPFLFALPIVLNPLFLLPYLLASLVNTYVGYLAISSGIVPIFQYAQPSVLPAVLQGFVTTGDPMGGVLQLVWLALDIVIYSPFVIVFNLLEQEELQPGRLAKEGEGNA